MLFLNTQHSAQSVWREVTKHASKVARWIVLAGTHAYGRTSDVPKTAGMNHGLRRLARERPEWTVIFADARGMGLTVLSRDDRDKHQPPNLIRKALNFTKALAEHATNGSRLVDDATYEARLDVCALCPHRYYDACGKCGCPVDKKASWAEQQCPDDPPRWKALPVVKP
jgi:hypothetical protein